jgi:hypothetical protein
VSVREVQDRRTTAAPAPSIYANRETSPATRAAPAPTILVEVVYQTFGAADDLFEDEATPADEVGFDGEDDPEGPKTLIDLISNCDNPEEGPSAGAVGCIDL